MWRLIRWLATLLGAATLAAPAAFADGWPRLEAARDRVVDVWRTGASDIYVPFLTYHLRFAYDREKINTYDEYPFGLGYGRSKFDADGNWHGLYAMGFQDSHYKPNYMAGYGYQKIWRPAADWRAGAGLTAFLMMRTDIAHYTPFPGVLPVASIGYKSVSLETAYVPGGHNVGNVLFVWGRIRLE